jgi:hypothetical protein
VRGETVWFFFPAKSCEKLRTGVIEKYICSEGNVQHTYSLISFPFFRSKVPVVVCGGGGGKNWIKLHKHGGNQR